MEVAQAPVQHRQQQQQQQLNERAEPNNQVQSQACEQHQPPPPPPPAISNNIAQQHHKPPPPPSAHSASSEQAMASAAAAAAAAVGAKLLVSVACQTEPNLIDKLIDTHIRKQLDDVDLYQEYVRSAQCAQFWPLDKNPIRSLVPAMLKVDLPEQHLKNESLMFDLVQAITTNSKLVNLLAKYIHHIVPNVIISKRIDLIPLITCTIRVCRDTGEQERLFSLLFNLIKRPNEEQRRMILSGIIVVLQVSPNQNSSLLLLPNLWDHVNDKFPERRILLAESCATLAHYVRPIMRTNLVLSILVQLLKDKNAAVRSAACKSFACLLTLIMDRNDEVFDACLSATEDIVQDVLQQTPLSFCEHRYELEQMRLCVLETIYPLVAMWAVKLNRFKLDLAEFYLAKADKYFAQLLNGAHATGPLVTGTTTTTTQPHSTSGGGGGGGNLTSPICGDAHHEAAPLSAAFASAANSARASLVAAAVSKRRSMFFESRRQASSFCGVGSSSSSAASSSGLGSSLSSASSGSPQQQAQLLGQQQPTVATGGGPFAHLRRQSAFVGASGSGGCGGPAGLGSPQTEPSSALLLTSQRAISAYLKMLSYLVPFVFSDAVHSCAWLTKSRLHSLDCIESPGASLACDELPVPQRQPPVDGNNNNKNWPAPEKCNGKAPCETLSSCDFKHAAHRPVNATTENHHHHQHTNQPSGSSTQAVEFANRLLEPTMIVDESAIFAFHDQLKEQEHMTIESVSWILDKFLPRFLRVLAHFSHKKFYPLAAGGSGGGGGSSSGTEVIHEFLFSTLASVRQLCSLFGKHLSRSKLRPLIKRYVSSECPALFFLYIGSLTAFEPIEQQEFEEILASIKQCLGMRELTRNDVEMLAISIKILATQSAQIHSPSTRQRFLTYVLDALVNYSNSQLMGCSFASPAANSSSSGKQQTSSSSNNNNTQQRSSSTSKEFMLILYRHILTCLIDPAVRPAEWAHILVTKFLPSLIMLANDASDVYVCTYARLMCAQLVDTFDSHLSNPQLTQATAASIMPALASLKSLTEQIRASNLKRQIDCLTNDLNEKFFKQQPSSSSSSLKMAPPSGAVAEQQQPS